MCNPKSFFTGGCTCIFCSFFVTVENFQYLYVFAVVFLFFLIQSIQCILNSHYMVDSLNLLSVIARGKQKMT